MSTGPNNPRIEDIFSSFKDLFGEFFANAPAANRGADLVQTLELSHVEARDGAKVEITVERGIAEAGAIVRRVQTLVVSVPAGVERGQTLRLVGKGDDKIGGTAGYLYLKLDVAQLGVPRRRGSNTIIDVAVGLRHVLVGGSLVVQTLDGPQPVKVPRGVADGDRATLAGRGASRAPTGDGPYRGSPRGDVHVVFRVAEATRELAHRIRICAFLILGFVALAIVLSMAT